MRRTFLLKTMLLLCALIAGSSSAWAVDQVYKTLTFCNAGTDQNKTQDYNSSWDETVGSGNNAFTWTIENFNNNQWGWTDGDLYVIKCGRKKGKSANTPSVATIVTDDAIDEAITKVVVKLTAINSGDYNSIKLYIAPTSAFVANQTTTINVSPIPTSAGDMTITIPEDSRATNQYYKLEFDTKGATSSNGHTGITKVEYYYNYETSATLQSLTLSGTYPTDFYVGDEFSHTGMTVTANYSDNSHVNVTNDATFSGYNMSTAGNQTVTVNYSTVSTTYDIVVSPVPPVVLTLDFSTNILGLPDSDHKATTSASFNYNGYPYTLEAGTAYYWASSGYVLIGKNNATFTFPAYPFKVKRIKIYGTSVASESVTQNIFVEEEQQQVPICTATTGAKNVTNVYTIPTAYQTIGTRYILKVTNNANTQISKIEILGDAEPITITAAGLATFASDNKLDFTNVPNIEAYIAKEDNDAIILQQVNKVDAGTGVLLRAKNNTTEFAVPITTADADDVTGNLFVRGTGGNVASSDGGYYNYVLSKKSGVVGFYRANNKEVAANRAYLHTTIDAGTNAPALAINFGDEGTTGIVELRNQMEEVREGIFDLSGRRVENPTKGLYIVNGKKVIIK